MNILGTSLYTRLAVRVALVLGVSGLLLLAAVLILTRQAADDAWDRILTGSALQVAENTWYENGRVNVDVPVSTFSMLTASDQVFYAVIDPGGVMVAGDSELQTRIPYDRLKSGPVVVQGMYRELPVTIAIVGRRMALESPNPWAVILLAQTNNSRHAIARTLGINTSLLILAMGVLTVFAALLTLRQALTPLKQIATTIDQRPISDLSALTQVVPAEIHSLVAAINEFMRRLEVHRSMMRGVIGDAAHQLRTPVAALLSQMELLRGSEGSDRSAIHLARLRELAHSLGELVNQLINHAMVQFRAESVPLELIDLAQLAREVMAEKFSGREHQRLDIGFEAPDGVCLIQGDVISLREALKNIMDNALLYGTRTLLYMEVRMIPAGCQLRLEDDGPGIAEADWDQVRQPFSARRGSDRQGASLGLSIVNEVMRGHHGTMQFGWSEKNHFVVSLDFPRAVPA